MNKKTYIYWKSGTDTDIVRARAKKVVIDTVTNKGHVRQRDGSFKDDEGNSSYSKPEKVAVEYIDTMDLINMCLNGDVESPSSMAEIDGEETDSSESYSADDDEDSEEEAKEEKA
jgi:hypothetical protein